MRRRSTEKGIDMDLKKCVCVRINDRKEIKRYFGEKIPISRHVVNCRVATQSDDNSTLEFVL